MVHEKTVELAREAREMKALLKPSLTKILLALGLFIVASFLWKYTFGLVIMDVNYFGWPLHYLTTWGPCRAGENCSEFNGMYLVFDLLFWYMIGAWIVNRFSKKTT